MEIQLAAPRENKEEQGRKTRNTCTYINNKRNCAVIQLDTVDFYHSISKDLFTFALEFDKDYSNVSNEELNIKMNCRRFNLINNNEE